MRIFRKRAYIPPLFMLLAATLCLLGTPHWANASEPETHTFSPEEIAKLEEVKRIDEIQQAQVREKVKQFDQQNMNKRSPMRILSGNSSALGTFGDILINPGTSSASSSFIGHAAIVSMNNDTTIESFPQFSSPIHEDGVRRYANRWRTYHGAYLY